LTGVKIAVKVLTKTAVEFASVSPQSRIKLKHFERAAGNYDFGNTHACTLWQRSEGNARTNEPIAADAESKDDQKTPS
jgi:hypothetical protein